MSAYESRVKLYGAQFEDSFFTHNQLFHIAALLSARQEMARLSRYNALDTWAFLNSFDIDRVITELKRLEFIDDDLHIARN